MNCRPGDMVMFIKPVFLAHPYTGERVMVVRCGATSQVERLDKNGQWVLKDPIAVHAIWSCGSFADGVLVGIEDSFLMPIRNGGLEDETPTVHELEAA